MHPIDELRAAYCNTTYLVHLAEVGPASIRIGQSSSELDRWLAGSNANAWAFITACNPRSAPLSVAENEQRTQQLKSDLEQLALKFAAGKGVGDDGEWPPEPSFLVAGITRADAARLAKKYGQNALVFGRSGHRAELVWTSHMLDRASFDEIVEDFCSFVAFAGFPIKPSEVQTEFVSPPHVGPDALSVGQMAVFVFGMSDSCLMVGRAIPKVLSRPSHEHDERGYAVPMLASHVLKHVESKASPFWPSDCSSPNTADIGGWLEQNVWRAKLVLQDHHSPLLLNLLEAFVNSRLNPMFGSRFSPVDEF